MYKCSLGDKSKIKLSVSGKYSNKLTIKARINQHLSMNQLHNHYLNSIINCHFADKRNKEKGKIETRTHFIEKPTISLSGVSLMHITDLYKTFMQVQIQRNYIIKCFAFKFNQ
jgi:hypothetical protein